MLLTVDEMGFLNRTTVEKDGMRIPKENLTKAQKERLKDIDERNYFTYGEHMIALDE